MQAAQSGTIRREYGNKLLAVYAAIAACIALGAFVLFLAIGLQTERQSDPLMLLMGVGLALVAIYVVVLALRSRLVLDGERIAVRGAFRERSAERSQIEGYRTIRTRGGDIRQLVLKEGRGTIDIDTNFDTDDDYNAWMQDVPDLDERDKQQLLAEIESRQDLGATPEERLGALAQAKQIAVGLTVAAGAAVAGLNFGSKGWIVCCALMAMLAPLVAAWLCIQQPLLYAFLKKKADPRAETFFVLMVSGLGLLIRMREVHMVSLQPLLIGMILVGLLIAALFYWPATQSAGRASVISVLIFAGMYAYGAVAVADVFLDRAKSVVYSASVVGSHVQRGKSTTYYLRLSPWGPVEDEDDVSVAESIYSSAHIGDQVCLNLSPGWLKAAWFRVVPCDEPGSGTVQ